MKSLIIILTATTAALAQNLSGQPACATACLISAISAAGCAPLDLGCQCGPTQAAIGASAALCLIMSCSPEQLMQAQSAGSAQCAAYSVTATASHPPSGSATATGGGGVVSSASASTRNYLVSSSSSGVPSTTAGVTAVPGDRSGGGVTTATAPVSTGARPVVTAGAAAGPAVAGAGALLGLLGVAAVLWWSSLD